MQVHSSSAACVLCTCCIERVGGGGSHIHSIMKPCIPSKLWAVGPPSLPLNLNISDLNVRKASSYLLVSFLSSSCTTSRVAVCKWGLVGWGYKGRRSLHSTPTHAVERSYC